jgi:hypothetical protein
MNHHRCDPRFLSSPCQSHHSHWWFSLSRHPDPLGARILRGCGPHGPSGCCPHPRGGEGDDELQLAYEGVNERGLAGTWHIVQEPRRRGYSSISFTPELRTMLPAPPHSQPISTTIYRMCRIISRLEESPGLRVTPYVVLATRWGVERSLPLVPSASSSE